MSVWHTTRLSLKLGLASIVCVVALGTGCSFDAGATGFECSSEGAHRPGEVCRDGFWRIVPDASGDGSSLGSDTRGGGRSDAGPTPDAGLRLDGGGAPVDGGPVLDGGVLADTAGADVAPAPDTGGCTPTNGGVETCDGLDNDCDGQIDGPNADGARTFYRDGDGDGHGTAADSVTACSAPTGYVTAADDCNDADPQIHPGAPEICDGAIDDNCNQQVDENCPCTNGHTRSCGSDVGACAKGTQTCTNGQWTSTCVGEIGPQAEQCDDTDDDCDGQVDEDFTNKGAPCTVGQGACQRTGQYVCAADGSGTVCSVSAGTPAAQETCGDGIDNDCNGQVDDGCSCHYNNRNQGVCANAVRDANGNCQAPSTYEQFETSCDGLDNDCNGLVDEGLQQLMYPDADGDGYGSNFGVQLKCPGTPGYTDQNNDCDDGDPWTHPNAPEICDGKDNNCNGRQSDDGGRYASAWCASYFPGSNSYCGGPRSGTGHICCEDANDGNLDCDFETLCGNGIDEDGDQLTDCADDDCAGMSCGDGKTCQSGSCQPI